MTDIQYENISYYSYWNSNMSDYYIYNLHVSAQSESVICYNTSTSIDFKNNLYFKQIIKSLFISFN